jgi:hypothetical protein
VLQGTTTITKKFSVIVNPGANEQTMPSNLVDGINYNSTDATKATLVLDAPLKDFVYVAGSFNNWSTTANNLGTTGNGIYGTFVMIPLGSVIQYKFVNGNNFENVPTSCTVNDGNGNFNRSYYVNLSGVNNLPLVCFNECGNCQLLSNTDVAKEILAVYPNPVKAGQSITVQLVEDDTLRLYDITGKLIDEKIVSVSNPSFEIGTVSAGIYFLKSKSGTAKIVVH